MSKGEDSGDAAGNTGPMLRPDGFADRLSAVSLEALAARGIRGIIVDLDNTLVGYRQTDLAAEDVRWLAEARERGFRIVLVSNNFNARVKHIGESAGVATIASALKPLPHGFRRALAVLETPKSQTVVIGDQLFTDVLGAKLLGLHAILTQPVVPHDFITTRILRFFERLVLAGARK